MKTVAPKTLDGLAMLREVPADDRAGLAGRCAWQAFDPDEAVFEQDSDSGSVFFIIEGSVRVLNYSGRTGREVTLAVVEAGDSFGELAAIDRGGRSARVVAVEPTVLARIDGDAFRALLSSHACVAMHVMHRFAHIIRSLDTRVTELSTLSESQRVINELIRLSSPDSERPRGRIIAVMPKHQEIASLAGTTRETVAQTIGELAREGVLERRTMGLRIKDWDRLRLMGGAPLAQT